MPDFVFAVTPTNAFTGDPGAPAQYEVNNYSIVVQANASNIAVSDDDAELSDSSLSYGGSVDQNLQVLASDAFGNLAGRAISSDAAVFYQNSRTGDIQPLIQIVFHSDSSVTSSQVGQVFWASDAELRAGDVLTYYGAFTLAGQVTYEALHSVPVPSSSLSVSSVTAGEGDVGSVFLDFRVTRTGDTTGTASASYAVSGSGTNPTDTSDFNASTYPLSGTVNFAAGASTATIRVAVASDYSIEHDETFSVTLSAPVNTTIAQGVGTGTILNDDTAGTFAITGSTTLEGDAGTSAATFTVTRTGGSGDAYVSIFGYGGSATAGTDYVAPGQLDFNFSNGAQTVSQTVTIIGDREVETDERIQPTAISYSFTGRIGPVSPITIVNDDSAGRFSVADVFINEGDFGATTGFFTVTRASGNAAASVSYSIVPGSGFNVSIATPGVDYAASQSGTINFYPGQTSVSVPFQVLGDFKPEPSESFRLILSNPTNGGSIGQAIGIATIIDNDAPPGSQFGTEGNDVLIANRPHAFLVGLGGNDTYLVNDAADVVSEQNGGGTDIVYTTVSYNLGANEVEALSVANQMTTDPINVVGNYASQTIVGNYGDNLLNGGGGADTLIGLFGNDTYAIGDSHTVIQEQVGQGFDTLVTSVDYQLGQGVSIELFAAQDRTSATGLRLTGNELAQTIAGTAGADAINGGGGVDTLIGGGGVDTFVISAVGEGNVAVLADFSGSGAAADRIGLSTTAFAAIGATLDANEFVTGTAATTADQHIIYNASTGQLFYDADGSGTGAAVLFAQVVPGTVITAASFDVVQPVSMAA